VIIIVGLTLHIYFTSMYFFLTGSPSDIKLQGITTDNRVLGIEEHDLTLKCKIFDGKPPATMTLLIGGTILVSKTGGLIKHTISSINRSYDLGVVTCQAKNIVLTVPHQTQATIYLNCKYNSYTFQTQEGSSWP